jgi:lipid A 4'-phosphatase
MAERMTRRLFALARNPWMWALLLVVLLLAVPAIDIGVSGMFFDPVRRGFPFRSDPLGEFVRKILPGGLFALAGGVALLGLAAAFGRRPRFGIAPRTALYLLAVLALGPGLLVNVVLKDNWGRPRPSTISEFLGPNTYTRPLVISTQCDDNCSFPSGHAALGFWAMAFALLAPPRHRTAAVVAALAFGGLIGLARIAQGGHFVSDVVFSGVLVCGLSQVLHRWIIDRRPRATWKNNDPQPGESP